MNPFSLSSIFPTSCRTLLLFVVLASTSSPLAALDRSRFLSQYVESQWGLNDGLPQLTVLAIQQTRDGYLWLGTQEGIVRFDGVTMKVFEKGKVRGLSDDFVKTFYEDKNGYLWLGTRKGLLRYVANGFEGFADHPGAPKGQVNAIAECGDGALWVGTEFGLYRYFEGVFAPVNDEQGIERANVTALWSNTADELWVGTLKGLSRMEVRLGAVLTSVPLIQGVRINTIERSRDQSMWIGTDGGLTRILPSGETHSLTTSDGLKSNSVHSFVEDREGLFWIGTSSGISRYDGERILPNGQATELDATAVNALLVDAEGSLWVGANGLFRLRDGNLLIWGQTEGLPSNIVRCVIQDQKGAFWFGTEQGLVVMRGGKLETFDESDGLISNVIQTLFEDRQGRIWIGSRFSGLSILEDGKFTNYSSKNGLPGDKIRAFYQDRAGAIWIGILEGGLVGYDIQGFRVFGTEDGLSSNRVYSIFEDRNGGLWVGTDGQGVNLLEQGRVRTFTSSDGLAGNIVYTIHESEDGDLWLGTSDGLSRYHQGRFQSITLANGMFNSVAFGLVDDGKGRFWMSCNKGIHSLLKADVLAIFRDERKRLDTLQLGPSDGMRSQECNFGGGASICKAGDGSLLFPTMSGVVQIRPGSFASNDQPPPVWIEEVLANGAEVTVPLGGKIQLPPDLKKLEIRFTALSFTDPSKVRFRYRLKGFEDTWTEIDRRVVYYTSLSPKSYEFQVLACNNDGIWNNTGATIQFVVQPYFYQTIWFYLTLLLLLIAFIYGVHRLRIRAHLIRERKLEAMISERTQALVHSNRELVKTQEQLLAAAHQAGMAEIATNVLHNLGNALNSVNVTTSLIDKDVRDMKIEFFRRVVALITDHKHQLAHFFEEDPRGRQIVEALHKVADSLATSKEKLIDEIRQLDDQVLRMNEIIRGQQAHMNIGAFWETIQLSHFVRNIVDSQAAMVYRANIQIVYDFQSQLDLRTQKSKLVQVLLQLLRNAVQAVERMPQPNERKITIRTRNIDDLNVAIDIEDTGVGLDPSDIKRIFFHTVGEKQYGTGFGLHYCANALMEMKGKIHVKSEGLGKGTRFTIELPTEPPTQEL